jgi:hypothetical protein
VWFSSPWQGWTFGLSSAEGGWLHRLLEVRIDPGHTWWFAAFSWHDLAHGDPVFGRALRDALASLAFFGVAALVFWRLSCRRFVKELPPPIASRDVPSGPEVN